jgi:hypothetical protein
MLVAAYRSVCDESGAATVGRLWRSCRSPAQ